MTSGCFRRTRASVFALVTTLATTAAVGAGHACEWQDSSGQAVFPVQPNLGEQHLLDAAGRPFLITGDSPWSLIADLTREDADLYLRDRRTRGFNTLLVNLIEHKFTRNAPANAYGERPFLEEGDFSRPNPAYFNHAGWVLERACELGFLVLLTPAYAGYGGGDHGWYADMVANGPDRLRDYGRFVAERFGHLSNIVWVQGGDYDPPDKSLVRAIVAGINASSPTAIHTVHGAPESRVLDYWADEPWLAINNVYSYGDVRDAAAEQYRRHGDRPFFYFEGAYENEFGAGGARVRTQAYEALLSGASGQLFGNNPIWHFDGPGLHPKPMDWEAALDSPAARSMTVLNDLFSGLEWWRLEPDLSGRLLATGRGRAGKEAIAAMADDGSFALVYVPTTRPVRLRLNEMSSRKVRATWIDPATGQVIPLKGSPFEATGGSFQPPAHNAAGDSDWVLMLSAEMPRGGG
jgi:hypothetical protein